MKWLRCLFMGHIWEAQFHPPEVLGCSRAFPEGWAVCLHCGKDSRSLEEVMDDNFVTLEMIELRMRSREP